MKDLSQEIRSSNTHEALGKDNKKLNAMLHCKCPVCKEGDMFKTSALNMSKFNELNKNCKECGFDFMPEPGLWFLVSLPIWYLMIHHFGCIMSPYLFLPF